MENLKHEGTSHSKVVCQLLILRSAGGWCLVTGDVFHTSAIKKICFIKIPEND